MEIIILSTLALVSALFAIIYRETANAKLFRIFKPLTTILIIGIGGFVYSETRSLYAILVLASLFFALVGDIFLINDKYFLQGLSSFLIAHILFTVGFAKIDGFLWNPIVLAILILIGGGYFKLLKKNLADFAIPVAVYILVIVIMCWQAVSLSVIEITTFTTLVAVGSVFFVISDAIIAYAKFINKFKFSETMILGLYWLAIYSLTLSGKFLQP